MRLNYKHQKMLRKQLHKYFPCVFSVYMIVTIFNVLNGQLNNRSERVKPMVLYWPEVKNDISCHNSTTDDALQSVDDPTFQTPKAKSIFFHETSCRGGIDSRQACAIESAAKAHPNREVYLLFNSPVTEDILKKSCLAKLLEYSNIRLARIHANTFAKFTIVHPTVTYELLKSKHPIEHSADIMRMLTLNKWGGVYLDLDMLVVKSFDSLPENWIAKETENQLSTGVVAFSKNGIGNYVTSNVLLEIFKTYNPKRLSDTGASAIETILKSICNDLTYGDCQGINIYTHEMFYPIHYSWTFWFFKNQTQPMRTNNTYTYHMWNPLTKIYPIYKTSMYARLASKYCPKIYKMYGEDFGE